MPGRARRWTIAVVGMVIGVLGLGAVLPAETATGDVGYVLAWDTNGVTWNPDGTWSTTTDLGYSVTVEAGSLTTFSATMVACDHSHGIFSWLFGTIGPRIALAGHGGDDDAALIGGPISEPLTDPQAIEFGTTTVHEPAYCVGHTNWGTVDPTEPTLVVTATWIGPDGTTGTIDVATTIDWGVDGPLTLDDQEVHIEVGQSAVIEIRRSLATMFDGVDLSTDDERTVAMGIYRALAASTVFAVIEGDAHL